MKQQPVFFFYCWTDRHPVRMLELHPDTDYSLFSHQSITWTWGNSETHDCLNLSEANVTSLKCLVLFSQQSETWRFSVFNDISYLKLKGVPGIKNKEAKIKVNYRPQVGWIQLMGRISSTLHLVNCPYESAYTSQKSSSSWAWCRGLQYHVPPLCNIHW